MNQSSDRRPTFEQVFEAEAAYICRTLARLGVANRDVEDLAHDTFLIVYRQYESYDPNRPLRPWLFGIAFRVALAYRRRASTRSEKLGEEIALLHTPDSQPSPLEQLESAERQTLVRRALQSVADDRLAVFVLHEIDGFSMPEVVRAEGIPLNTGYSRLRLARQEFRHAISRLTSALSGDI